MQSGITVYDDSAKYKAIGKAILALIVLGFIAWIIYYFSTIFMVQQRVSNAVQESIAISAQLRPVKFYAWAIVISGASFAVTCIIVGISVYFLSSSLRHAVMTYRSITNVSSPQYNKILRYSDSPPSLDGRTGSGRRLPPSDQ